MRTPVLKALPPPSPSTYGALLLAAPATAHAHGIHPVWVAAALSPLVVLLLVAVLAWLSRSARIGLVHGALIVAWVVLFWLASAFVQSDYVIWTPLVLYLLHSAVIVGLLIRRAFIRGRSSDNA